MNKILLVEDNLLTAKGLAYLLEREHYAVTVAHDFNSAKSEILSSTYDLVLLDVGLPGGSGLELAAELKRKQQLPPTIFLTARDEEENIVHGLSLGAEDYITKPFRSRELLLRITNALARQQKITKKMQIGQFSVDPERQEITFAGAPISLTALEYQILTCFLENSHQILTRERIMDEIWSASGKIVNDNTVSVYLKRLRQKLPRPDIIETVKKLGYRINTNPENNHHEE